MFLIIATGTSLIKNNRNSHRHRRRRLFRVLKKEKLFSAISSPYTYSLSTTDSREKKQRKTSFPNIVFCYRSESEVFSPTHWVCSKFTFFGCEKAVNCTSVKIVSFCCVLSRNESIKVLKIYLKARKKKLTRTFPLHPFASYFIVWNK